MNESASAGASAPTALVTRFGTFFALIAGSVYPLAFAPFGFAPVAILSLAALLVLWSGQSRGVAARRGFAWGFGAFLAGLYWLYISLHTFGKAPLWLALPLMLGLVAIMALYPALVGYLFARFSPRSQSAALLLMFPGLWVIFEWIRGWFASGFPWLAVGYSQTDTVLSAYAPVGGVYLISAAVAVSAGVSAGLILNRKRAVPILLLLLIWLGAAIVRPVDYSEARAKSVSVALLQGAISQDRKWLPEQFSPTLKLYSGMTQQSRDADLVIWPEAAIPALLGYAEEFLDGLWEAARAENSALLIGIPRRDGDSGKFYNSVLALGATERTLYDKRHLVPFGEYFPVPEMVRSWMRLMNLPYSDFAAGDADQALINLAGENLAITICYEDVFGAEQLPAAKTASILVNVSNDAWFGDSIAPHQHLQIARMRAMETRRPMLRATNTGISAVIDAHGRLVARSRQFEPEVLRAEIHGRLGSTPYMLGGDWFAVLLSALAIGLAVIVARRSTV